MGPESGFEFEGSISNKDKLILFEPDKIFQIHGA